MKKSAQSAMEYLMTYGWSILLIAIVIAAVYALGVFNNNPLASSNTCIAQSGFLCSKLRLNSTGVLNVTFGQSYGTTYTITGVACTNSTNSAPSSFVSIGSTPFYTGQPRQLNFQCPFTNGAIGSTFSGVLWIQYNTPTLSGQTAKVGIVNAKVTTSNPQGISSYTTLLSVPITLTNLQSTATGSNFQEMLSINSNQYSSYINTNWMNVEFTTGNAAAGTPGTILQAWVESGATNTATNTVVWVNLPSGIAATSSTTVYMNMLTSNIMSASGPTGEAPQLSGNYAQYDNGANVFSYYNVAPTSTSGFSVFGTGSGVSSSAPSGGYFGGTNAFYVSTGGNGNYLYSSNPAFAPGVVISYWMYTPSGCGNFFFLVNSAGAGQMSRQDQRSTNTDNGQLYTTSWTMWSGGGNIANPTPSNWDKFDIVIPSTGGTATIYISSTTATPLGTLGSANGGPIAINNNGNYFGFQGDTCAAGTSYANGLVVRRYAPSGVMPGQGNGLATPSQVIHYVPITLTNSQGAATPSNYQANVVLNAGAYKTYESSTLQNIEFFYANGTVIPSWMEGNTLNEQQTTNLYTSNTITYWLNIGPQIAASGGTQVVYVGFAANTVNLLNSVNIGEAPQLSSTYGQYDDGFNVFSFYDNFAGSSLNAKWTHFGAGTMTVSNGVTAAVSANFGGIYAPFTPAAGGLIEESYFYANQIAGASTNAYESDIGFGTSSGSGTFQNGYESAFFRNSGVTDIIFKLAAGAETTQVRTVSDSVSAGSYYINQFSWSGNTLGMQDIGITAPVSGTDTSYGLSQSNQVGFQIYSGVGPTSFITYWTRVRNYPPNNVAPNQSFGAFT